jgi:hypothetical protein
MILAVDSAAGLIAQRFALLIERPWDSPPTVFGLVLTDQVDDGPIFWKISGSVHRRSTESER